MFPVTFALFFLQKIILLVQLNVTDQNINMIPNSELREIIVYLNVCRIKVAKMIFLK